MIYHILPEREPFSDIKGGALSRWVGNVARDTQCVVVCPDYDETWQFPPEQILQLQELKRYGELSVSIPQGLYFAHFLRVFGVLDPLRSLIPLLVSGDILWVHNRPYTAAHLEKVLAGKGIKIVLHLQNSKTGFLDRRIIASLRETSILFCSDFLATETAASSDLTTLKNFVVYNGANGQRFFPSEARGNGVPRIAFAGRIVQNKGIHVLLAAMQILQSRGVTATCTVIGGPQHGRRNTAYAASLKALTPSNTTFCGYLAGDDLAEALRNADIFCCPSTWNEPFGMVIVEAMASGLPVVASDVGGIPEILRWGGGTLVPPNNPEALANALEHFVLDASARRKAAEDALQSFREHFTWPIVRKQYREILDELQGTAPRTIPADAPASVA